MTTTELIDQIRAKAMAMPKAERAELAEALFAVGAELEDIDVDRAAGDRIRKRAEAVHQGSANLVSAEVFFDHIRARRLAR